MARENSNSSRFVNNSLIRDGSISGIDYGETAFTMACWHKPTAYGNTSRRVMMWAGNYTAGNIWAALRVNASGQCEAYKRVAGGGTATTTNSTTAQNGSWSHFAFVEQSNTQRYSYLDGDTNARGSNTTNIATGINSLCLGINNDDSPDEPMYGSIAWPAFWVVALSSEEIESLAAGAHPLTVRPDKLRAYWQCSGTGGEADLSGYGNDLTEVGTMDDAESNAITGPSLYWTPANYGGFSQRRKAIIAKIIGDQSGGSHWDEVKDQIPASALVRTSDTVATLDLSSLDGVYDNTADEGLTLQALDADMWTSD